jgi:hypothetical protein
MAAARQELAERWGVWKSPGVLLGVFCKSFRRDIDRFERLFESFLEHVASDLSFVLSVPREDEALFAHRFGNGGERLAIVTDEHVLGRHLRQSWRTQQLVKLHAYKLRFAEAWLVVDSDFIFHRPFGVHDMLDGSGQPRFVVSKHLHIYSDDDELVCRNAAGTESIDPITRQELAAFRSGARFGSTPLWARWLGRRASRDPLAALPRIQAHFSRPGPVLNYMPGPIWTTALFERMQAEFLAPARCTFADLIAYSPWECVWVGEWAVANGGDLGSPVEPYFFHFHSQESIRLAKARGVTIESLTRHYAGIQLAASHYDDVEY